MADSFGAAAIQVTTTPFSRVQDSDAEVIHIPGGDTSYVDLAGKKYESFQLGLYFTTYADYAAFKALVNTTATLTYTDGSYSATLISSRITQRAPSGIIFATADFLAAP